MSGETPSPLSAPIPAGWYPDPAGGDGTRWWDGDQWTSHIREPEVAPPPLSFGKYLPPELRSWTPLPIADVGISDTRVSWWIAFSPMWSIVPQAIVVESIMALSSAPISSFVPALAVVNVLIWAVVLVMAFADRAKLRAGGNPSAASPFWVLLTPLAYLIARARRVRLYAAGAWTTVIWWCVAVILTPGLVLLGIFAAYGVFAT